MQEAENRGLEVLGRTWLGWKIANGQSTRHATSGPDQESAGQHLQSEWAFCLSHNAVLKECGAVWLPTALAGEGAGSVLHYGFDAPVFPCLQGPAPVWTAAAVQEVLRDFTEAARALELLHAAGMLHLGLSPDNLVRANGRLCLTGLGSAQRIEGQSASPAPQAPAFLSFSSPEMTGRLGATPDARADLYSLAASFHFRISGQPPVQGADIGELLHAVLTQVPASLKAQEAHFPAAFIQLLQSLLAKSPDQRLPSASAVVNVMEEMSIGHLLDGEKAPALAVRNLRLPLRLIGRENEHQQLANLYARAAQGQKSLILLSGGPGMGKSMLAAQTRQTVIEKGGIFAQGKYQQFQRASPYLGLVEALNSILNRLLMLDEPEFGRQKQALTTALGSNSAAFSSFLPGIEWLVGKQAAPTGDEASEEISNRIKRAFRAFLQHFAKPDAPLVLVLDDVQWAGAPTFSLLEILLEDGHLDHLFLILISRNEDEAPDNPFQAFLKTFAAPVKRIELQPFGEEEITAILSEALEQQNEGVNMLAKVLLQKTGGNPLFTREYILRLYRQQHIRWSAEHAKWKWDLPAIQRSEVLGGAELMAAHYRMLSDDVQKVLQFGACYGHQFLASELQLRFGFNAQSLTKVLAEAVDQGILLPPIDRDRYTFAHDLLQQTAYEGLTATGKSDAHFHILSGLLSGIEPGRVRAEAFELLHHFSRCPERITTPALRLHFAHVGVEVARKAKGNLDFGTASTVLKSAKEALSGLDNDEANSLKVEVGIALYEAVAFLGDLPMASKLFTEALATTAQDLQKVRLHLARARVHIARSELAETMEACRDGLRLLSIPLPAKGSIAGILKEFLRTQWLMRGKKPEDLKRLPRWEGPASEYLSQLLYLSLHPAYVQDPQLYGILAFKALQAGIKHGVGRHSAIGFTTYATFLAVGFDDFKKAAAFFSVADHIAESIGHESALVFTAKAFARTYEGHLRDSFALSAHAHAFADAAGQLREASESLPLDTMARLHAGVPLSELDKTIGTYLRYVSKAGVAHLYDSILVVARGARRFMGQPMADLTDISGAPLTPARMHAIVHDTHYVTIRAYHELLEVQAYMLAGQMELAGIRMKSLRTILHSVAGAFTMTEIIFWDALISAHQSRALSGLKAIRAGRRCAKLLSKIRKWAKAAPSNFAFKIDFVEGIRQKDPLLAVKRLEAACQGATANQFLFHAAYAAECAGRRLAAANLPEPAKPFLEKAHRMYSTWGAKPHCLTLESTFPEVLANLEAPATGLAKPYANAIDLIALLKVSSTISMEISLSRLLGSLIRIVTEYAGAERGLLLLESKGDWYVQARWEAGDVDGRVLEDIPAEDSGLMPKSMLTRVLRQHELQVFADARYAPELAEDAYVRKHQPKSLLCMPLKNQAQLSAVLYLENNLNTAAFSAERLEVLDILAAQAAVALENVRLYLEMEARVDERTRALTETLQNLRATQDQLVQTQKLASLGQVTAGIAHEIRNPLNFVNNFSELSMELADELSEMLLKQGAHTMDDDTMKAVRAYLEDLKGNADKIQHHGRRAERIVHNMLMHAASGAGEQTLVDLNPLAREYAFLAFHGIRGTSRAFQCALEFELDPSIGLVRMNQQDISRTLLNIFQNALQAMDEKVQQVGGAYAPVLLLRTENQGSQVAICIRDNGLGIPDHVRSQIFDPFFTTKPTGRGTGLGLSLAYDLVVQGHGGQLTVESVPGEFTEFKIILPIKA